MSSTPLRAAIIGTGSIAGAHGRAIRGLRERIRVVAAMDVDESRLQPFCLNYEIPAAFTDAAQMLEQVRPDIVHICTPPSLHAPLAIAALEAGAWVLCEKPLCASLRELDAIQDAEARTGNYCSSVFQFRFGAASQHVKKLIETGAMGRPLVGLCQTTWYRSAAYYAVPWRGTWQSEVGGTTMTHGIHTMDLFLYLLGDWKEVRAKIGTLDREIEVDDVSMAIVEFANGALGSIVNSALSPRQETMLRLDFQKATVEVKGLYDLPNEAWQWSTPDKMDVPEVEQWRAIPGDATISHATQIVQLMEARAKNERPLVSGDEARRTLEFLSSMYKTAATGQPVTRGSILPGDPFYEHVSGTDYQTPASV